jgi:predicted RNA binding protein YcfA (HicA-like mRNA interferase family)
MKASDFVKLIEKQGWVFEREGKGSHIIYKHKNEKHIISVPFHGSKDIPKGLLNKLKKQAGIK